LNGITKINHRRAHEFAGAVENADPAAQFFQMFGFKNQRPAVCRQIAFAQLFYVIADQRDGVGVGHRVPIAGVEPSVREFFLEHIQAG
jgi:hypothetical protein